MGILCYGQSTRLAVMIDEPDAPPSDAVARAFPGWLRDLVHRLPEIVELSVQVKARAAWSY